MHTTPHLTQDRLERVLRARLRPRVATALAPLTLRGYAVGVEGQDEPIPAADILTNPGAYAFTTMQVGDSWGPAWGTCWIEVTGTIPAEHITDPSLELMVDLGWLDHSVGFQAEGIVYDERGHIIKALNPRNAWIPLIDPSGQPMFAADGSFRFFIEAAANPLVLDVPPFEPVTGGEKHTAGTAPLYVLKRAEIVHRNVELAELVHDFEVAGELAQMVPESEPRHHRLLVAIDEALDVLNVQDLDATIGAARERLASELAKPAGASAHHLWATGHAHIDSAWLWPLRETVRKVARTVSNQLMLMDLDPDYIYSMSSAQQFAWIEENYPELFERVRARVAEGRFIPVGGMWVESDTNMPSGEAMVRQFVYGKRYFLDRFGIEPKEVWLPDSFGYSAALPQLARAAGFSYFLTQKISWNDTNAFPHHTFSWEGIDSSRIFTHFPPADTYGAELTGRELAHAVSNFRDKGHSSHSLIPFGYGDGGGGATREHLARARRWANIEGAPRVHVSAPSDFFEAAQAEYTNPPVWKGELYLELHRGTYTSQHATKQGNRHCEALLLEAERACTAAHLRAGAPYPYDELEAAWRTVLLHQFHDILPGSSIAWVHREAAQTYARLEAELTSLIDAAERAGTPAAPEPLPESTSTPVLERVADGFTLVGNDVAMSMDAAGRITSLRFGDGTELVAPGRALAAFELLRDEPVRWDAWDIDARSALTATELTADSAEPLTDRVGVRFRSAFSQSTLTWDIYLTPDSPLVHIEVAADWQECERLLRLAFPFDLACDEAQFETQFGHVTRNITTNTSWQVAQHEVCAQRWVRLSQGETGVALVNESSYGHMLTRDERTDGVGTTTTVRVSVLRAPRFPDPETDRGQHAFAFALAPAPHVLDAVQAGRTVGRRTNANEGGLPTLAPGSTALIEAIKLADDRSGDVVVRLYEAAGAPTTATLTVPTGFGAPVPCDLLERVGAETTKDWPAPAFDQIQTVAANSESQYSAALRGFEVVTVRLPRI